MVKQEGKKSLGEISFPTHTHPRDSTVNNLFYNLLAFLIYIFSYQCVYFLLYRFLKQKQNHNIIQTLFYFLQRAWRRKWQPTPVFLPAKSHGWWSLAGYVHSIGLQRVRYDWVTYTLRAIFPKPQIRTHGLQIEQTPGRPISIHSTFAPMTLKMQEVGGGGTGARDITSRNTKYYNLGLET